MAATALPALPGRCLERSERQAANVARRAEIRRASKAGEIPSYGENYGGK